MLRTLEYTGAQLVFKRDTLTPSNAHSVAYTLRRHHRQSRAAPAAAAIRAPSTANHVVRRVCLAVQSEIGEEWKNV